MANKTIIPSTYHGNEALTVGEHIKLFFSELSTEIDAFNAKVFNSSIHTVNTKNVFNTLISKNNYFDFSTNQIPTPVFFNPNKIAFNDYVSLCLSSIGLLTIVNDELTRSYKEIKSAAATGKLSFAIRSWDHNKLIDDLKTKLDLTFENTGQSTRAINQVYVNLTQADVVFKHFNKTVANLKSRDVEIVSKKTDDFIEILKILKRKVESSDIKLSQDDLITVELVANRINELLEFTGRLMAMLNDLTRHLELQIENFLRYVK